MDLPDDGVKCLGDEGQLGSVGRRGGVIPDPQTFEAVVVFEGHPSRSPGSAVDPETPRGAIVLVGVLLPTDVIRAKFVFCYSHTSDRGKSGDKFRFSLELGKGGCKGLEVICVLVSVGFPESKAAVGVIFFKDREKDVEKTATQVRGLLTSPCPQPISALKSSPDSPESPSLSQQENECPVRTTV